MREPPVEHLGQVRQPRSGESALSRISSRRTHGGLHWLRPVRAGGMKIVPRRGLVHQVRGRYPATRHTTVHTSTHTTTSTIFDPVPGHDASVVGSIDTITGTQLSVGGAATVATTQGDIILTAANVVAQDDLLIHAAGDLTLRSGQGVATNANRSDDKAIGTVVISDTERFAGYHTERHRDEDTLVSQVATTVGSLGGNVTLVAGGGYTQTASHVVAENDVSI